MFRNLIFILIALFVSVPQVIAHELCSDLLSSTPNLKMKSTDSLIVYLSALLEDQIITHQELLRFVQGLEKGEILNPISEEKTLISMIAAIHHEGIQKYIEDSILDRKGLLDWAKRSLTEKERIHRAREEAHIETQDFYQQIEFHPVPAGSYRTGANQDRIEIAYPFEMMSTLITQKMWVELMGENPSQFINGDQSRAVMIKEKRIKLQPNHPVEKVTWWSVLEYANRLSVKAGLKPTYDFDDVEFEPDTSAEAGTLKIKSGLVKINAPNEDIYLAEGYRLPTSAEMEYVIRSAGKTEGKYHFGDDEALLKDYAWYRDNSDEKTHAVAELKPLMIDGKELYDVLGNVHEWVQDFFGTHERVNHGGSWCSYPIFLTATHNASSSMPSVRSSDVGFRLVRTSNPQVKDPKAKH